MDNNQEQQQLNQQEDTQQQQQQQQQQQEYTQEQNQEYQEQQVQQVQQEQQQQEEEQQQQEEQQQEQQEEEDQWEDEEEDENLEEEQDESSQKEEEKDNQEDKYGCQHYLRKCEIQAPCCKKWFGCRLCHNNEYTGPKGNCPVEIMDRYNVSLIKCLICGLEQEPSNECKECTVEFARYYCSVCKFWNDKEGAQIYHCDKCNMCRVGQKETLFHCDKCNVCLPIVQQNNHKCIGGMENQNCPVCMDNLKISTEFWITMKCGHAIHQKCYNQYVKIGNNYKCPLCQQSLFEMPKHEILGYDKMVEEALKDNAKHIPKEFKEEDGSLKKVDIICNQCSKKSLKVDLNPIGLKCQQKDCGSYLTDML